MSHSNVLQPKCKTVFRTRSESEKNKIVLKAKKLFFKSKKKRRKGFLFVDKSRPRKKYLEKFESLLLAKKFQE